MKRGLVVMNSPAEVAKNYIAIGKGKATNGFWKLLVLGVLAGAFIGLGSGAWPRARASKTAAASRPRAGSEVMRERSQYNSPVTSL